MPTPVPKPDRPVPQRAWKHKAIDVAKKIVRLAGVCSKCGRRAPRFQMHAVHIMSVKYGSTCADRDNLECMCGFCHTADDDSAHLNERDFHAWFDAKYPGRRERLAEKARQICRIDFEALYDELLTEYHALLLAAKEKNAISD